MTKRVKNFKVREIKSHIITGMLALVAVLLLLIFLKHVIENGYVPRESASTPETISVNPLLVPEDSRPLAPTLAQGSFTELFSGAGWMNSEKTNVYQDDKLSSISFPPDYEWDEVPALSEGIKNETIIAANGNGREVVLVTKSGKFFKFASDNGPVEEIRVNPLLFSPQSAEVELPGEVQLPNIENPRTSASIIKGAFLDYDDAKQTWVVAAVSETGDALIGPIGLISPTGQIGLVSNLVCANGECLILSGSKIYRFAENNPSALIRVDIRVSPLLSQENPRESASMLSLGKAGNILLVGAVEKIDGIYNGSIFKYSGGSLIRVNPLLFSPQSAEVELPREVQLPNIENPRTSASIFSSSYPGTIRFGYDKENSEILVLYAAYIGQAKLLSSSLSSSSSDDFSRFFPQRVMDGNITPKIFKHGNAWWLSSEVNKPVVSGVEPSSTKFVRIEGGAGVDFADTLISSKQLVVSGVEPSFELLPGFGANELYALVAGQDGAKIYKFIDKGYKKDKKLVWESLRLNRFDNEIVSGRFYKINGSTSLTQQAVIASGAKQSQGNISVNPLLNESNPRSSASIFYYLSNDGGKTWQETKLNEKIDFRTKGNDFRFKVELDPDADVSQTPRESASTAKTIRANPPLNFTTPWLNLISVEYYSKP